MKPETADYLAKARTTLADAGQIAMLPLLATAYQLKATVDYGIGPAFAPISVAQATAAITTARRFIDTITQLLPPDLTPPRGPSAQP